MRCLRLTCLALCLVSTTWADQPADIEKTIFEETNAYRAKHDRARLELDPTLNRIARAYIAEMARRDKYGDDDKNGHVMDGKWPWERAKAGGYEYIAMSENVGWSQGAPDPARTIMKGWIESPGHRQNLINADYTDIGIGAAQGKSGKWYFVQMFGKPVRARARQNLTPATEPVPTPAPAPAPAPAPVAKGPHIAIENQTRHAIRFRLSGTDFELAAGALRTYWLQQKTARIPYGVTWPSADAEAIKTVESESGSLKEGYRYAFVQIDRKFKFIVLGNLE